MKLPKSTRLLPFLILIFISGELFAQDANSVKNSIEVLADGFPQEKIYLHYDKPAYTPGETLWFKAYLLAGTNTDDISKTVYIDFLSANGTLLKHCVQTVYQSSASGDFDVPVTYTGQEIFVKAYTKWMLNFDSNFLYRRSVHIIQSKPPKYKETIVTTAAQFLPESGNLVEGIESKIAFKAVKSNGLPASIQGSVINQAGVQQAQFKTMHDGMGFFMLTPKAGDTYTVKWKDGAGNINTTALPAADVNGVNFKINLQKQARSFIIQRSENAPDNLKKIFIVATMQQHLVYFAAANLSDNYVTGGSMPVSQLPSGILQITLFDSAWKPVAERITFINNDEYYFEPEAGFSELGLDKRKQNTLVIDLPDSVSSNLSVAVTDSRVGIDSTDDIISRLLLTSDLKGTVYYPSYYFKSTDDSLQQQLDLVMLTNGWRRIKWDSVVANKFPAIKYQNDTDYLNLSGKVFGATETDLKQGALIVMMLSNKKDTARKIVQAFLNKKAAFAKPEIVLFDTTRVFYKVAGGVDLADASSVVFNGSMPSNKFSGADTALKDLSSDTLIENFRRRLADEQLKLLKLQEGNTLADVTVKTKIKSPLEVLDEKYTSALFSGGDAIQFDVLNDPFGKTAFSVLNYLQGKVAGLNISTSSQPGGSGSATWRGGAPSFYLDEVPVQIDQLSSINMTDVAYIKVLRPPFMGADGGGGNGAIAVYTRKGGDVAQEPHKSLPYKVVIGYTVQKQFYSPDYGSFDNQGIQPDLRTTLYWNPMILTNRENHSIRIHFYNNDITKSFRLVLEGMSTDGKLTHIEKVVE